MGQKEGRDQWAANAEANVDAPLLLDDFLPYRLSMLANTLADSLTRAYTIPHRLSITQWRVMSVLGQDSPMASTEICDRVAMDKIRVSRAVRDLEKQHLIVRRVDLNDRRRTLLRLNKLGYRVYSQIVPRIRAIEADLLDALTAEEIEQLNSIVDKLQARVRLIGR